MKTVFRCVPSLACTLALFASLIAAAETFADEPAQLAGVSEAVHKFVESKEIAGAVTLVADEKQVLHLDAVGMADVAGHKPMRADAIFWIASMTKPVTGTAVMMMQDEGKLSVDDPVEKYIPELAELRTRDGKKANITIRHLLTHTSGMAEISPEEARKATTLAELMPVYAAKPVGFEPGSKWQYCQSSINTAARVVEVVSGMSFVEFLDKRIFGPLGMKDTTFYLSDEQLSRLAKSYKKTGDTLEEADLFILGGKKPTSRDRFPAANGGLFSTAGDYARFCQMVLGGGEFGGKRYLKPGSVKLMTSIQTGDLKTGFTEGNGWGLGWCVVRKPQGPTEALSPGSHGHGGAYGTQAWIDPEKKRIYLLMVQRSNFPNADASDVRRAFQAAAAR
ncbi:MAG: serine hydrolase [Planctomycetota bacterium]|nr:MAG: serine hydrolase [Planctomycetota bacterium]